MGATFTVAMAIIVCLVIGVFFIGWNRFCSINGKPPSGVQLYFEHKQITVTDDISNDFAEMYSIYKFLRLNSGKTIVPILRVKEPKFSGLGNVHMVDGWRQLGTCFDKEAPFLELPYEKDISSYLVLMRRLERPGVPSQDSWRVWEISYDEAWKATPAHISFPRYKHLPLLVDRLDKATLLTELDSATLYWLELRK